MDKLNLTEAKDLILNNNLGSIYSKEDVINLLNRIEEEKKDEKMVDLMKIRNYVNYKISDFIKHYDFDEIIDKESAGFDIKYGNTIELDTILVYSDCLENDLSKELIDIFDRLICEDFELLD